MKLHFPLAPLGLSRIGENLQGSPFGSGCKVRGRVYMAGQAGLTSMSGSRFLAPMQTPGHLVYRSEMESLLPPASRDRESREVITPAREHAGHGDAAPAAKRRRLRSRTPAQLTPYPDFAVDEPSRPSASLPAPSRESPSPPAPDLSGDGLQDDGTELSKLERKMLSTRYFR